MGWFSRKPPPLKKQINKELQIAAGMTLSQINMFGGTRPVRDQLQSMYVLGYIMGITEAAVDKVAPRYRTTPDYQINLGAAYVFTYQDADDGTEAFNIALANQENKHFKVGKKEGTEDYMNYYDFQTTPHYLADFIDKEIDRILRD